ncbi:DNA polymerase III subunit gamma/tau [Candidatus Parcubacteria bacterium]|nr:MAG: DNA polymerase III subunit gamma/tau [Candidatus Parcubacteria bacterium]
MGQVLYRKYRPQKFDQVIGQEFVVTTIKNQIKSNKIAHSYLFSGPRGVGKTTVARLLAKAVNCSDHQDGEPCGKCQNCIAFDENSAIDIVEMDGASHNGVDNVRENIIEAIKMAPSNGRYRVFIIDEVHMLTGQAFNALLKTLEEPPEHAVFIMATTEPHKVPDTIKSRCQHFNFSRIAQEKLFKKLKDITEQEDVKIADEILWKIVELSCGYARDAESLLGQILSLNKAEVTVEEAVLILPTDNNKQAIDFIKNLEEKKLTVCMDYINSLSDQGVDFKIFTSDLLKVVRQTIKKYINDGENTKALQLNQILKGLMEVSYDIRRSDVAQLPLEIFVVEYCLQNNNQVSGKKKTTEDTERKKSNLEKAKEDNIHNEDKSHDKEEINVVNSESGVKTGQTNNEPVFELEELKAKWGRCCEIVSRSNIALPLVLQKGEPIAVYGNRVHIAFRHSFHFETMSQKKNLELLREAINEVMGTAVEVMPIFEQDEAEKVVGDLAQAFGGTIID